MTSTKKILANQNNAKKSTGPKTVAGKIRSSLNSIKHSLTSEKYVAIGENKKEFEELKQNALKFIIVVSQFLRIAKTNEADLI